MRILIDYIRSCFCKHEWECVKEVTMFDPECSSSRPIGTKWVYRCKKCYRHKVVKDY